MSYKRFFLIFIASFFWVPYLKAQSSGGAATQPTYRLSGAATLASNFVEKGLTQTKGDPGLQTDFWFNFGSQFRMGLWGANVRYDATPTTHFWLRANADVRVDFSGDSKMNIIYSENKYYKENNRNGNLVGVHFDFSGWKIIYDMESNWQGTGQKSSYAAAGKDSIVMDEYIWANRFGYTMPEAEGVNAFFDIRTGLGTKAKDFLLMGSISLTNAARAFKDQGKLAFIFSATVGF